VDADKAEALGRRLWEQIERRRFSSGHSWQHPRGIRGCLDYYRGNHKLRFASGEFDKHFQDRFAGFSDNWCAPVIDAKAERLNWMGMRLGEGTREADQDFLRVMEANDVPSGMSEAFTVALATGRAFALVWGNNDEPDTPIVTFEHPEFCIVATDPATRRTTAAAKGWVEDDTGFLTLYTPDEVWKWRWSVSDVDKNDPRKQPEWRARPDGDVWPIPNPLGRVPMVEFRNQTLLDDMPLSDLAGVAAMQDAINLAWAYLFNGLDYASLPQRLMTGAEPPSIPVLDADGKVVGKKAVDLKLYIEKRVIWVPDKDAKPSSWPAADLKVFGDVIELAVDHVASQTRTPPHYLMGKMSNTAAESLTVAETGLVASVLQRQQYFTKPVREIHELVALAQGDKAKAKAARTGKIVWKNPQYRAISQMSDGFAKYRAGGLPLEHMLEWLDYDPAEVARVMAMAKSESDLLIGQSPIKAVPGKIIGGRTADVAVTSNAASAAIESAPSGNQAA